MKKTLLLLTVLSLAVVMNASDIRLVVQKIDNGGVVAGNTYRVFAELASADQSLNIVYGDQTNPLTIQSTAPFYQHQYGGHSAASVFNEVITSDASMKFDSWITLGYSDNVSNDMWDLGVDFSAFDNGGSISCNNGGWFLIPTDEKCQPGKAGLVLIAQFTSTGTINGVLNLQGKKINGDIWNAEGLTFNTTNAEIFGCTDQKATNYNELATYHDGSCAYASDNNSGNSNVTSFVPSDSWDVFPNPLRDNLINVQFNHIDVSKKSTRIDIMDMNGKLVGSHNVSADALIGGNRVVLSQDLAAGKYNVMLIQEDVQESKIIIVQK